LKNPNNRFSLHSVKFANIILLNGIIFSVLIIFYSIYKIYFQGELFHPNETQIKNYYFIYFIMGLVFCSLFIYCFFINEKYKVNISIFILSSAISIYMVEISLAILSSSDNDKITKIEEVGFDSRTKLEVLNDLKRYEENIYLNISPKLLLSNNDHINNVGIYPLGGISNVKTVFCNESGEWIVFDSDEYGFNNAKGLYFSDKVDIALIGDSYTEGACVKTKETIGSVLNMSGFNAISFGKGGNGPLIELATIIEYAKPIKPKIVLWLFFKYDLDDLLLEFKSPILRNYLKDNFSQKLIFRQSEIDSLLMAYSQRELDKTSENQKSLKGISRILKMYNIRSRINLRPKIHFNDFSVFKSILSKAKNIVSDFDGKLYFVYLPGFYEVENNYYGNKDNFREKLLLSVAELNIPIIDVYKEVFENILDPLSLFPFKLNNHYTSEGYRLTAESIKDKIEADLSVSNDLQN